MISSTNHPSEKKSGRVDELMRCVSRFSDTLLRVPLEPTPLSSEVALEAVACPLSLHIAAPRELTSDDVTFDVLQPWCYPYRSRSDSRLFTYGV